MTYSNALYKPSVLELAQAGNCQALTYWINSFLGPQGIYVRVQPASSKFLKIVVDFQKPNRKESCISLRDRLVRFICYRLWILNSEMIGGVRIVARISGDPNIIWQQSIRINSHTSAERHRRSGTLRSRQRRELNQFRFQVFRSLFLSSITLTGFFLGYWFFYIRLVKGVGKEGIPQPSATTTLSPSQYALTLQQEPQTTEVAYAATSPKPNNLDVSIPEQFQGQTVSQVDTVSDQKVVALTFDDGPWLGSTDQILAILKQYNIKATFFMVGMYLKNHPEIAQRVAADGHAIGNHSWSHPLHDVSLADAAFEIDGTAKLIYDTTGVKTTLFRPPGGFMDDGLADYARQKKYAITTWSVDPEDYYVSAPIMVDNVLKNVKPGRIVLMHDGGGDRSATVQALPQIIATLQQQGYKFVTVPELMKLQAPEKPVPVPDKQLLVPEAVEALAGNGR